ncbi:hypothetical protein NLI96_g1796 [Meripilus lineatus]|uniref:Uncharacterized protein n=1 Tax=Meripilus lineatus TaxID=2056292 RepID=A0AAD5V9S7_9APHY|nr:hypothetical protein NLI96_g1796 [Physisporinus lineatus]
MPDWDSPQEEAINRLSFVKLIHAMAGVYLWEFVTSLHFEWSFISGKKKFTWPMIFYFSGRYCALCCIVTVLVALDSVSEVNCQALYTAVAVFTQLTIGFASINLALRAYVSFDSISPVIGCVAF